MKLTIEQIEDGYRVMKEEESTGENYPVKTFRELIGVVIELLMDWSRTESTVKRVEHN